MFVLRGIAVALTFFVLLYGLLSLVIVCGWRGVRFFRLTSARGLAHLLFGFRVFPLAASACVTLAFVIPAYVRLEPRAIEEDIALPLVLALGCLALFALGLFRVVAAQAKTSRVVADWLQGADALDAGVNAPTFRASRSTPPLTLVGVCSPRVLVSEATVAVLNPDELRVAVRHEMAHMRSRDNLKKLVFYCAPFFGMSALEGAWQEAAELAADDGAVSNAGEALDLAAALIKLSRLIPVRRPPEFTMALVSGQGSVTERVERLLAWNDVQAQNRQAKWRYAIPPMLAMLMGAVALYSDALTQTHRISEWLVR